MRQTVEKLKKYSESKGVGDEVVKALYNMEIIRFYSLMQIFTRKLVNMRIHDLLYAIIQKEIELDVNLIEVTRQKHISSARAPLHLLARPLHLLALAGTRLICLHLSLLRARV